MRRVILLTLLALALPTAALANSFIPDSVSTGNIVTPSFGLSNPFSNLVSITVMGTDATVSLSGVTTNGNGIGGMCSLGVTCFFTGGTVHLTQGSSTFTAAISSGSYTVTMMAGNVFIDTLTANLKPDSQISGGTLNMFDLTGTPAGAGTVHWKSGNAVVDAEPVPEPSALEGLLLGTGMIGLAEMSRRKLKLGT